MYPRHVQKVVNEAQREGGDLSCFSDDELSAAYAELGATSESSFGLKIKAEIDRREKSKASRRASHVRALNYLVTAALMLLSILLTIKWNK